MIIYESKEEEIFIFYPCFICLLFCLHHLYILHLFHLLLHRHSLHLPLHPQWCWQWWLCTSLRRRRSAKPLFVQTCCFSSCHTDHLPKTNQWMSKLKKRALLIQNISAKVAENFHETFLLYSWYQGNGAKQLIIIWTFIALNMNWDKHLNMSKSNKQKNTFFRIWKPYILLIPKKDCFLLFPSDLSGWFPQSPLALSYAC